MRIVRAWPYSPPPGRPHVVDGLARVPVDSYDYRPLLTVHDDVVSLDWDTACSREDLAAFCARAAQHPAQVLVAPMRIYRADPPPWNLVRVTGNRAGDQYEPVADGEEAHLFGFGMVYLPAWVLNAYTAARPGEPMTDAAFADWHHAHVAEVVRVDWSVRPVHLHYPEAETGAVPAAA